MAIARSNTPPRFPSLPIPCTLPKIARLMESPEPPAFLDVAALIERSQPHPRVGLFGYAAGLFLLVVATRAYVTSRSPQFAGLVDALSKIAFMGIMTGLA